MLIIVPVLIFLRPLTWADASVWCRFIRILNIAGQLLLTVLEVAVMGAHGVLMDVVLLGHDGVMCM